MDNTTINTVTDLNVTIICHICKETQLISVNSIEFLAFEESNECDVTSFPHLAKEDKWALVNCECTTCQTNMKH